MSRGGVPKVGEIERVKETRKTRKMRKERPRIPTGIKKPGQFLQGGIDLGILLAVLCSDILCLFLNILLIS